MGAPTFSAKLTIDYDIEGADVGYRWNAREGKTSLFPLGYRLSYTSFSSSGLVTDGKRARFRVVNTGARQGATVGQLYLLDRQGKTKFRLVGFQWIDLAPAQSRDIELSIDPRQLTDWVEGGLYMPAAEYRFAVGVDAEHLGPTVSVNLEARRWKD